MGRLLVDHTVMRECRTGAGQMGAHQTDQLRRSQQNADSGEIVSVAEQDRGFRIYVNSRIEQICLGDDADSHTTTAMALEPIEPLPMMQKIGVDDVSYYEREPLLSLKQKTSCPASRELCNHPVIATPKIKRRFGGF